MRSLIIFHVRCSQRWMIQKRYGSWTTRWKRSGEVSRVVQGSAVRYIAQRNLR